MYAALSHKLIAPPALLENHGKLAGLEVGETDGARWRRVLKFTLCLCSGRFLLVFRLLVLVLFLASQRYLQVNRL